MRMDHVVKVDQMKRKGQSVEEENRERNYPTSWLLLLLRNFFLQTELPQTNLHFNKVVIEH